LDLTRLGLKPYKNSIPPCAEERNAEAPLPVPVLVRKSPWVFSSGFGLYTTASGAGWFFSVALLSWNRQGRHGRRRQDPRSDAAARWPSRFSWHSIRQLVHSFWKSRLM